MSQTISFDITLTNIKGLQIVYDEETGRGWINVIGFKRNPSISSEGDVFHPHHDSDNLNTERIEFQTPLPQKSQQSNREREGWTKLSDLQRQIQNLVCDHEDHDDE